MKNIYELLRMIASCIAVLIFLAGILLVILGCYEFITTLIHAKKEELAVIPGVIAIGLLSAVDILLVAIVLLVFSIGILLLFNDPVKLLPVRLPEWLRVKNFMQLKIILWEAVLTTLVVGYLSGLAEKKFNGEQIRVEHLVLPGGIFLVSLSLYFLKRGEK
ncbi:MAG: YqhA family protein [Agriterribacter sp.]